MHTEDTHVEWVGFNAYLDRHEASKYTKKPNTLVVFGPRLDAPLGHPYTVLTTLVYLEKDLEDLWNAISTPLSRPTVLSDIVSCAMERPLPLEISGATSPNVSYADVVSWVHRDGDEGIRCGCATHCKLRRIRWHNHRQVMD